MDGSASWSIVGLVALLVLGAMWTMGARRLAIWIMSFVGGVAVIAVVIRVTGCADAPPRPELARDGAMLVHPFGFEVLAPSPPFQPDHVLEARLSTGYMRCWAWAGGDAQVVVCGVEREVQSRDELVGYIAQIQKGFAGASSSMMPALALPMLDAPPGQRGTATLEAMAKLTPQWQAPVVEWDGSRGDVRVTGTLGGGAIQSRILTVEGGFALVTTTSRGTSMSAYVDSLRRVESSVSR